MVRNTSLQVFHKIKTQGLLSKRRMEIYSWLYENGPATAGEIAHALDQHKKLQNSNVSPRLGEMRAMGVVAEVSERACRVSGHKAIEFDVTSSLPVKPEKKARKRAIQEIYNQGVLDCMELVDDIFLRAKLEKLLK